MIIETVVITRRLDGTPHIAPMGVTETPEGLLLQPFRPSATLDNLERDGRAVINATDDVQVIAGCLTGRRDWPCEALAGGGYRLSAALSHREVEVFRIEADELRPRFFLRTTAEVMHRPWRGFNRAQAAVVEAAILASRLDRLAPAKISSELDYLRIAIDKTAGPAEREAWQWLLDHITRHREQVNCGASA